MKEKSDQMFDAIAVNIKTSKVRIFGQNKTLASAEAISRMAVIRRGVNVEFYTEVPAGKYNEGDTYKSENKPYPEPEWAYIGEEDELAELGMTRAWRCNHEDSVAEIDFESGLCVNCQEKRGAQ